MSIKKDNEEIEDYNKIAREILKSETEDDIYWKKVIYLRMIWIHLMLIKNIIIMKIYFLLIFLIKIS